MTKYHGFGKFLAGCKRDRIEMSFQQVERVLGQKLPPSAYKHRPWWSNNPSNNALTQVWLAAGYRTENVDMSGHKVSFQRARIRETVHGAKPEMDSWFGRLQGLVWLDPDYDFTQPPDPDLAEFLEQKYSPGTRAQGRS